jgi:hypothetical protein
MYFSVTMDLVNRSKQDATYSDDFDPAGDKKRFFKAEVDDQKFDVQSPYRMSGLGLKLSKKVKANQKFVVRVEAQSTFHSRDSEIVGVYFPCASLSIRVRKPPDGLVVHGQSLLRHQVDREDLPDGDFLYNCTEGVLPHQGVRLFWERRP